jgi:hypothetical protein
MPRPNENAECGLRNAGLKPQTTRQIKRSVIITTGESIVREHRKSEMMRAGPEPYDFKRRPIRIPWYRSINWNVALAWASSLILAFCLIYLGIFVFGPFCLKLAHR